jgi:UDP-N-acetylglucosamine enolpyruvyl transferase
MTQAQATRTKKYAIIHDNIYDSRFNYVHGLKKLGAVIEEVNEREHRVYAGTLEIITVIIVLEYVRGKGDI